MRIFLSIALLSLCCSPLIAKVPNGQMALVCVDEEGEAIFIGNEEGNLELDLKLFEQAETQYQKHKAQQLIWAQEAHEINERNRIEYERAVSDVKTQQMHFYGQKIVGGMVVFVSSVATAAICKQSIDRLSDFDAFGYGAIAGTVLTLGVGALAWYTYQQIFPEIPWPKEIDWQPAQAGYPAIRKMPESSERRFQVFVPSESGFRAECALDRVLKAQDPTDGYLYPVHFKH